MSFPVFRQRRGAALLVGCGMAFAPMVADATEAAPLTLPAAVALAVRDAPVLGADAARVDAARADADRAGRLPDPELTFGIGNLPLQGAGAFTFGADEMTMRTIGVMQRLPARATREAERAQAQAGVAAADSVRTTAAADVRREAAIAWIAAWSAQRKQLLLGDLRGSGELAVRVSRARLAGGSGSAAETLAARAEVVVLESRIDAATAQLAAARAELARWVGPDAGQALADAPDFDALPTAPARLLARLDALAPLAAWPARERAAEAALDAARASKRPEWRVGASYGARSAGLPDMATLEVGVSLPLFTRHRQDPAISARHAERDAVLAEHEDARRAQKAAVESALAKWQGQSRQVRRYRDELLPLARDRTRVALAAYRGGADLQDWLAARRDEVDLRIAYADALDAWGRDWAALAYLLPRETTR